MQAALGHVLGSGDLIAALDAKPASSAHPKSGFRDVPDDMLNVIHQMIIPDGEAPCPLRPTHLSLALGSVRQLFPELPGSLQSETELHLIAPFPILMVTGRIIARTADKHALLGNGLSVIFVPSFPPPGDAAAHAMELNNVDAESSEVHFPGSWGTWNGRLCFASFYPNCICNQMILEAALVTAVRRHLWWQSFECIRAMRDT
jgi:hypothetical protein